VQFSWRDLGPVINVTESRHLNKYYSHLLK